MNPHLKRGYGRGRLHVLVLTLAAIFLGCASKTPPQQLAAASTPPSAPVATGKKMITGINTRENAGQVQVKIIGTGKLTYTAVKQPDPLGVVLYFPETGLAKQVPSHLPGIDVLSGIETSELTDRGVASRVEMALKTDSDYTVDQQAGGLMVSFSKPAAAKRVPQVKSAPTPRVTPAASIATTGPLASRLQSVAAAPAGHSTLVSVKADGTIHNFKSFTLKSPPRIVFDLFGLASNHKREDVIPVASPWIRKIRYYGYPGKVRMVLDTTAENLKRFNAWPVDDGLMIRVGQDTAAVAGPLLAQQAPAAPVQQQTPKVMPRVKKPSITTKTTQPPAVVNRIDFASEAKGRSTVMIGTTEPVSYALKKAGPHRVLLTLKNTRLPKYRARPLITTRFQSAVDRILPERKPGHPQSAVFVIDLRASVPYYVERQDRLLLVHFDATKVPPRPLAKAKLPAWEAVMAQNGKGQAAKAAPAAGKATGQASASSTAPTLFAKKKYTGEKIALDFYETDIKNVFRILKEVSGKDFAIDNDVTGTVTLSFDKPVPWDQVLDLILKMNHLGMVEQGNIIRIATLATLQKEREDRQAALEAQKKAEEQQVALEPLETVYIPINYASAKTDVLPQLQKLITKGRGSVSVDDRNNQIIMTDTAEKIAQARVLIKHLDTVTPQVIIEARIVEVSDTFNDDLGINWTGSQTNVYKSFLGGNIGWNVAMNYGSSDLSSLSTGSGGIGISFSRVAGTPLLLDATLTALQTKGEGKIISAPKIVTLDNQKAMIKQGLQVGYLERDDSGGSSVKFKNVDLLLEVTPHVTPDQRVAMNIHLTKDDVDPGGDINGVPALDTNEAQTQLLVNDGATIVIGGILKRTKQYSTSGFPGLSSVPVVNWLFRQKSRTDSTGELLIFITPQIVQLAQR